MNPKTKPLVQNWILLIHQLPPRPTNLRVRIWRKLQKLGAVAIKNSVYILPASEKSHEDFQWLKQEIESAGGEAAVFRAGSVEGATDDEIIAAFRKVRDEEFATVAAEFDGLTGAIREHSRSKSTSCMLSLSALLPMTFLMPGGEPPPLLPMNGARRLSGRPKVPP